MGIDYRMYLVLTKENGDGDGVYNNFNDALENAKATGGTLYITEARELADYSEGFIDFQRKHTRVVKTRKKK